MQVLVAGGAGYIGCHTAKALAAAGFTPIVLDNLSTGHADSVRWGPLIEGDISDRALLKRVFRDYEIDGVIHFAASAYVGESVLAPRAYFANNVAGSLAMLEEVLDAGIRNVVFSSTCATYGVPERLPITEAMPQRPVNPYGDSKLFVERALDAYGTAYGLNWTALRYFNASGADAGGEIGERHDPETHLVPLAIQAALGRRDALDVYGTDYATPDGTAVRDFVHVSDLAFAHVLALRALLDGGPSGPFNLGTGTGHTVQDVIRVVEAVSGLPVPVRESARRVGDPPMLVADATLARRNLGWTPAWTDLYGIVESAWNWHTSATGAAAGQPALAGTTR